MRKFFSFNSIIYIVILILSSTTLFQNKLFLITNAKCIMRSPCTPHKELDGDNPLDVKWYNCKVEAEPKPLDNIQAIKDFKKLCPSMYTDDNQPLCCAPEQLTILKKDILTAEALIGNCASCSFNFRNMWCYMTCSPNQSDFVIARVVERKQKYSLTEELEKYLQNEEKMRKNDENDKTEEEEDPEEEEEQQHEEKEKEKEGEDRENENQNVERSMIDQKDENHKEEKSNDLSNAKIAENKESPSPLSHNNNSNNNDEEELENSNQDEVVDEDDDGESNKQDENHSNNLEKVDQIKRRKKRQALSVDNVDDVETTTTTTSSSKPNRVLNRRNTTKTISTTTKPATQRTTPRKTTTRTTPTTTTTSTTTTTTPTTTITTTTTTSTTTLTESHKNKESVPKLLKMPEVEYDDAVTELDFYLNEEFLEKLVDSCRDIKLYGDDALQGFCGTTSKLCTAEKIGTHLGLKVKERPMNIHFHLSNLDKLVVVKNLENITDPSYNKVKTFEMKPVKPKYYACNESFSYGDIVYGARCSCKACHDSCIFYDEFKVARKHEFKIGGNIDGPSFIMAIVFLFFMGSFLTTLYIFGSLRRKSLNENPYRKRSEKKTYDLSFLLKCFEPTSKNRNASAAAAASQLEQSIRQSMDRTTPITTTNNENEQQINKNSDEEENNKNILKNNRLNLNEYKLNCLDKMKLLGQKLEKFIQHEFTCLGKFCATYPVLVIVIGLSFCSIMCLGYFNFKVENDPIKLWSAETSVARQNKKYFDENFGPFYRITQLIIEPKPNVEPYFYQDMNINVTALQAKVLNEAFDLYNRISSIVAKCDTCEEPTRVRLEDICYQPLSPENPNCAIQSIFQYWKNDIENIKSAFESGSHLGHLQFCTRNPFLLECLSAFGGPIQPFMVIGSYNNEDYLKGNAIVITFVINNYIKTDSDPVKKAMAWESEVLLLLKNYTSPLIDVYYTTERSIEDEIERETKADIKIIAISYVMMFIYLTVTLGKYSSLKPKVILIEMKIFLGLAGVTLVLLSVFSSGGLFTYLGVPATLISLEVIPFLLLAVGVDNIYVMVQTYQNDEKRESEEVVDKIARVVGKVGPSMLLTGTTQATAFLISAMTPMPGVRAFSLYASLAIILNFLMQITCFVGLLSLDAKREKAKRVDMFCCIKLNVRDKEDKQKSFWHRCFKDMYAPFIFNNYVRASVIIFFIGFFFACIAMCDKIKVGLDQKLAMPTDSYQIKYFEALQKHLKVGPPVYFVVKEGYDYSDTNSLRLLCGASNCDSNSLQSVISSASFYPNETYIAQSSVNWIDDYMEWLSADPLASTSSTCCHIFNDTKKFCSKKSEDHKHKDHCIPCPVNRTAYDFPSNETFIHYIKNYLNQNPSETCIKAGHAMYGSAVKIAFSDYNEKIKGIKTSHFMAYHSVLSTSDDFIDAMLSARQISDRINKILNNNTNGEQKYEVFPYSIFYVFYEQYVKIWQDATMQLLLTLLAIFICTFLLLSFDLFTSLIVTGVIAIIIIDMVGIMFLWNIELNAISLVNLVIAIGISVEFNSHIARAFTTSTAKKRKARATEALCSMGPPVFSGVLQSIVGISVLAFAHSQLFQVFYFRMYMSILLLGLTHGLIFLPVLLSYIGPNYKHPFKRGRPEHLNSLNENQNFRNENSKSSSQILKSNIQEEAANLSEHILLVNCSETTNSNERQVPGSSEMTKQRATATLDSNKPPPSSPTKNLIGKNLFATTNRKINDHNQLANPQREDSPASSKKSIDALLNDHNSNNSNNENETNSLNGDDADHEHEQETRLDESEIDNNNNNKNHCDLAEKINKRKNSFKLNIFRKLNNQFTDAKFKSQKSPNISLREEYKESIFDLDENPYKQITFDKSQPTSNSHTVLSSQPHYDNLKRRAHSHRETLNNDRFKLLDNEDDSADNESAILNPSGTTTNNFSSPSSPSSKLNHLFNKNSKPIINDEHQIKSINSNSSVNNVSINLNKNATKLNSTDEFNNKPINDLSPSIRSNYIPAKNNS